MTVKATFWRGVLPRIPTVTYPTYIPEGYRKFHNDKRHALYKISMAPRTNAFSTATNVDFSSRISTLPLTSHGIPRYIPPSGVGLSETASLTARLTSNKGIRRPNQSGTETRLQATAVRVGYWILDGPSSK